MKKNQDEPADKASLRLQQFEAARAPQHKAAEEPYTKKKKATSKKESSKKSSKKK